MLSPKIQALREQLRTIDETLRQVRAERLAILKQITEETVRWQRDGLERLIALGRKAMVQRDSGMGTVEIARVNKCSHSTLAKAIQAWRKYEGITPASIRKRGRPT